MSPLVSVSRPRLGEFHILRDYFPKYAKVDEMKTGSLEVDV